MNRTSTEIQNLKKKEYCQEGFKHKKHLNLDLDFEGIWNGKKKKNEEERLY